MRVFTIFNHGTGGWSEKSVLKAEIVNIFGNEYARLNQEFIDYQITEGVGGSGNPQNLKLHSKEDELSSTISHPNKLVGKINNLMGIVFGSGVKQNVENVVTTLTWLATNGRCPDRINMIGWSRGAVSCIRIAYELSKLPGPLSTVPVNIFAVDPVAGGGRHHEIDAHTLSPNVANYIATLALGEKRAGFTPVDHRILDIKSTATQALILPLPGIHSDTAKASNPAGRITFNLCYRFLQEMGSNLPTSLGIFKMSSEGLLLQYNLMRKPIKSLHKSNRVKPRNNYIDALKGGWDIRCGRKKIAPSDLTTDSDFFINEHHRAVFKEVFPLVYEAFFGLGRLTLNTEAWQTNWLVRVMKDPQTNILSDEELHILFHLNDRSDDIYSAPRMAILASLNLY